jgi:hypothetical protein
MKAAQIENGKVVNIIVVDSLDALPNLVDATGANIGDSYENGVFTRPPAPVPTLADYDAALTAHLDAEARKRNYADRISAAVRAGYPGPFQQEGIAFATWMDGCNAIGYQMLADFQAGNIPQPTVQEVLDALPEMEWP